MLTHVCFGGREVGEGKIRGGRIVHVHGWETIDEDREDGELCEPRDANTRVPVGAQTIVEHKP